MCAALYSSKFGVYACVALKYHTSNKRTRTTRLLFYMLLPFAVQTHRFEAATTCTGIRNTRAAHNQSTPAKACLLLPIHRLTHVKVSNRCPKAYTHTHGHARIWSRVIRYTETMDTAQMNIYVYSVTHTRSLRLCLCVNNNNNDNKTKSMYWNSRARVYSNSCDAKKIPNSHLMVGS